MKCTPPSVCNKQHIKTILVFAISAMPLLSRDQKDVFIANTSLRSYISLLASLSCLSFPFWDPYPFCLSLFRASCQGLLTSSGVPIVGIPMSFTFSCLGSLSFLPSTLAWISTGILGWVARKEASNRVQ